MCSGSSRPFGFLSALGQLKQAKADEALPGIDELQYMILFRWLRLEKPQHSEEVPTFRVGPAFSFGEYLSWPEAIACVSSLSSHVLLQCFPVWCWLRGINGMCSIVVFVSLWDIPEDNAGLLFPLFLFCYLLLSCYKQTDCSRWWTVQSIYSSLAGRALFWDVLVLD